MAETTEKLDTIDSSELFESAMSDNPEVQETEAPVAEAEVPEQPRRGPDGKFLSKAQAEPEQQQIEPEVKPEEKDEAAVPSWRLREINEERRAAQARAEQAERQSAQFRSEMEALRRQIAEQKAPKPEPVDIFADPNAWAEQQLSPFEQRMQSLATNLTLRASRAENVAIHGREAVNAAEKAVEEAMMAGDPEVSGLRAKMMATDDPVGVAVEWHKSRALLKETGGDLSAYRAKALDEALNDPAFLAKALERAKAQASNGQTKPRTEINMPPRLSRIPSAQSADDDGSSDDAALFNYAMR